MAAPDKVSKGITSMSKSFAGSFSNLATLILAVVPLAVVALTVINTVGAA
jgi:hypothetical protein